MTTLRCPTCGASFEAERSPSPPFCSVRCQQIDLGRWLKEEHAVPAPPRRDDEEEENPLIGGED
jgi:uncharacterized protein